MFVSAYGNFTSDEMYEKIEKNTKLHEKRKKI